jgi:site-specific DNA-methyltransferase (adenine-specific)
MQTPKINLLNIDCMEYMAGLDENAFDLAIVDPPYGIGMDGGNVGYKGNNNFEKKGWDKKAPSQIFFNELERVAKHRIIWGGNYFALPATRCVLVWDKGEGFYNRTYAELEMAWTSFDKNARMIKHDPLAKRDYIGKIHPTQKPISLYDWIFQNYAMPEMRILDTHLGSGSSAIAAHYFGCNFVGCEIDRDYFQAAQKRFDKETRQIAFEYAYA